MEIGQLHNVMCEFGLICLVAKCLYLYHEPIHRKRINTTTGKIT